MKYDGLNKDILILLLQHFIEVFISVCVCVYNKYP